MIFVGDIAHPWDEAPIWMRGPFPWTAQAVVGNLEGSIVRNAAKLRSEPVVFNHVSVLDALSASGVVALGLANNHIDDIAGGLEETVEVLRNVGVAAFGAGSQLKKAMQPAMVEDFGVQYILIGFGWQPVQCHPAGERTPGVSPLTPEAVLSSVAYWREAQPDAAIVVVPHWNFELEAYPQPAHRQLAFAAIDAGAAAVFGHHSHRVGGLETYKGCPIAYSLGNWWMPQGVFFGGRLSFPADTVAEVALEWTPHEEPTLHWFEYDRASHDVTYLDSEPATDSRRMQQLTPYAGMPHEEYVKWFREHRVKRKALPVYLDYRNQHTNTAKDLYVRARHVGVTAIDRMGLRAR